MDRDHRHDRPALPTVSRNAPSSIPGLCVATKFTLTVVFAVLVIIIIPIGVPAIFMMLMLRAKQSIGGVVNETALGGAKLAPGDADDESDTYGFLIKDYRPQYWYHEIVTYSRKLLLGGISVVMGRGTMAQTYFVITVEAFFQIHHVRTYPFVNYKHNVMESLGHCALMLMYAISLILRNDDDDWDAEWFPKEGYGWFLVFLFVIVLPSPTLYFYHKDTSGSTAEAELGDGFEENPLAIEMGQSTTASGEDSGGNKPARAKLAKMQREAKDALALVQKLQAENQQLKTSLAQVEATPTVAHSLGMELATVPDGMSTADNAQETAMKERAADESLSEETREYAKKAVEVLVSSELLDIEQAAALKKLDSDARFVLKQTPAALSEWLVQRRLSRYAPAFLTVVGREAAPSDLRFLTEDDVAEIGSAMTQIEKKRLQAALREQADADADTE